MGVSRREVRKLGKVMRLRGATGLEAGHYEHARFGAARSELGTGMPALREAIGITACCVDNGTDATPVFNFVVENDPSLVREGAN